MVEKVASDKWVPGSNPPSTNPSLFSENLRSNVFGIIVFRKGGSRDALVYKIERHIRLLKPIFVDSEHSASHYDDVLVVPATLRHLSVVFLGCFDSVS